MAVNDIVNRGGDGGGSSQTAVLPPRDQRLRSRSPSARLRAWVAADLQATRTRSAGSHQDEMNVGGPHVGGQELPVATSRQCQEGI